MIIRKLTASYFVQAPTSSVVAMRVDHVSWMQLHWTKQLGWLRSRSLNHTSARQCKIRYGIGWCT